MNSRLPIGAIAARGLLDVVTGIRPLTPQARTAGPRDIAEIKRRFELATDLYESAVIELMRALNENLPIGSTVSMRDFNSCMADARSEIVGRLDQAMEQDL